MTWKAYAIVPIDFGWEHLQPVSEIVGKLAVDHSDVAVPSFLGALPHLREFLDDFEHAMRLARDAGWEGDIRGSMEPRVLWLPGETKFDYAFTWMQDNNGTTFVVSPVALPWLDTLA